MTDIDYHNGILRVAEEFGLKDYVIKPKMTYGLELELGDVDRRLEIPPELGAWEYSETDVVNLRHPYKNVCCDPLGLEPPMGGEVNLYPGKTVEELGKRAGDLFFFFRQNGCLPTSNCISHTHVHIRVKGLRDDILALKKLTFGIWAHQHQIFARAHAFQDDPNMEPKVRSYLKWDGARPMPDYMVYNILMYAHDFEDFIRLQCAGHDPQSRGRPLRYGINTYSMKHTDTVEWRMFRHTVQMPEIMGCLTYAKEWMLAFLANHEPPEKYVTYPLPSFQYDADQAAGWLATKHPTDRGQKKRTLLEI